MPLRLAFFTEPCWSTVTRRKAERKAKLGRAPAYVYQFEKRTPVRDGKLKVPHTLEIAYAFDNIELSTAVTGTGADKQALADKMSAAWVAFARTGDPSIAKRKLENGEQRLTGQNLGFEPQNFENQTPDTGYRLPNLRKCRRFPATPTAHRPRHGVEYAGNGTRERL
jgi:carboxylesterase type B